MTRENNDLIELEVVQQGHQFLSLTVLVQLHEVLLQTVQVEFRVIINVIFKWILHVHFANFLGAIGQRR